MHNLFMSFGYRHDKVTVSKDQDMISRYHYTRLRIGYFDYGKTRYKYHLSYLFKMS